MSSKFLLSAAGLIASWLALPHHGLADAPDGYRATFEDPASAEASAIGVMQVDAASYVESLAAFGARLPAPRVGGSRPPASQAEALAEMKEMVLDYALDRFPHELVEVVIDLGDVPFSELKQLRSMDEETRGRLLAERVERIEAGQEEFVQYLESIGAKAGGTPGIVNHRQAWIPPEAIEDVLWHPDVKAVYPAWQPMIALYDGEETRQETFLSEYWNHGIRGETGGRVNLASYGGDDIKIAIVESQYWQLFAPNRIRGTHSGWQDWASGPSRIRIDAACVLPGYLYCSLWQEPPVVPNLAFHGTWVASIAAGDITQGQDSNVTNSLERKRRSGVAPEASIFYLNVQTPGDLGTAIAWAFLWGADIINLSMSISTCGCGPAADCGGVNGVIRWVTEGGALVVAAAGNENKPSPGCASTPTCNVCYPATRPEVISVGNVDTPGSIDYDAAQIADHSSRGWVAAGVGGQYSASFPNGVDIPAVSISAPGTHSLYFSDFDTEEEIDTYEMVGDSGTSFAAPVVSGGAGLIREELGSSVADARMLKAQVLAMGDGTGAQEPTPGVGLIPWSGHFWKGEPSVRNGKATPAVQPGFQSRSGTPGRERPAKRA